jgi:hypothetical protein
MPPASPGAIIRGNSTFLFSPREGRVEFFGEKENCIMASNQTARAPENRPGEVSANARPLPKPETKPTKFVIKIASGVPC